MARRLSLLVFAAATLVGLVACGGSSTPAADGSNASTVSPGATPPGGTGAGTAGPTTGPGSGPKTPPSVSASDAENLEFSTFRSAVWGWSIKIPKSWNHIKVENQPKTQEYWSTSKGIEAPVEISDGGIWLTVKSDPSSAPYCGPNPDTLRIVDRRPITIDGFKTERLLTEPTEGYEGQPFWTISVYFVRKATCYQFNFFTLSTTARNGYERLAEEMLTSFRF